MKDYATGKPPLDELPLYRLPCTDDLVLSSVMLNKDVLSPMNHGACRFDVGVLRLQR